MSRCARFFAVLGSGTRLIRSTGSRPAPKTPPSGSRSPPSSGCQVSPSAAAQKRPSTAGDTASRQIFTKRAGGIRRRYRSPAPFGGVLDGGVPASGRRAEPAEHRPRADGWGEWFLPLVLGVL